MIRRQGDIVCVPRAERSYSDHDTERCGIAGIHRHDSDNCALNMDVRLARYQCSAGRRACSRALRVVRLRTRLLYRGAVLFRVP